MSGKKAKVISVNESSLVDLKAELYRKETQLKREKVDGNQPKKAPIWQRKKELKGKTGKTGTERDSLKDNSYDKELEKSRLMLEAKSALYDKLSNGEIEVPSDEDDQDGRFLVDFHQKTLPKSVDEEDMKSMVDGPGQEIPADESSDKEWVEYVDTFGRSKMCLRKDLPLIKQKDGNVKLKSLEESKLTLLSDDMRREIIRKKWEEEVQEALDKPVGPIHYQDVMFDETHQHGVGYYKFSKVEEERHEQQTALNKLRAQTEQQRSKRERLLEKRKAAMDARLAKIRARKQRKLHEAGAIEDTQEGEDKTEEIMNEDIEEKEENEMMIGAMVERIRNKSTKIDNKNEWEKQKADLERFDEPKRKTPSYDPRSERNPEFAPPSLYEKTNNMPKESPETKWKQSNKRELEDTENVATDSQDRTPVSIHHEYTINKLGTSEPDNTSSSQWTQQNTTTQNYQATLNNTNPYAQNTSFNPPNTNLYSPFPNLPLPPIHTFPPPNIPPPLLPPPLLLPPYQIPPQYPVPYPPPSIPNNQQYPNVPR